MGDLRGFKRWGGMVRKRNCRIIKCFFILLICFLLPYKASAETAIRRVAGDNRYETAAAICNEVFQEAERAILVSGSNFPDAITAAPLVKKMNAPILLTEKDALPFITKKTLEELKVKEVYLVGGQAVISPKIEEQLAKMSIKVQRIAGVDRYETGVKIAQYFGSVQEIVVASGVEYTDALSIAPIACKRGMPILLSPKDTVSPSVQKYVSQNNINKTYVIGNYTVISSYIDKEYPKVERILGDDKYERNIAVLNRFQEEVSLDKTLFATGENFADALAGADYSLKATVPILFIDKYGLNSIQDYIKNKLHGMNNVTILGGESAVSLSLVKSYMEGSIAEALSLLKEGDALAYNKQYNQALVRYIKALGLNPNLVDAYIHRGMIYDTIGDIDDAIADYSSAIALNTSSGEAYDNRGNDYIKIGQYTKALSDLNHSIAIDAKNGIAYFKRGIVYYNQKKYHNALSDFSMAAKFVKSDPKIYIWYGAAYENLGNTTQAIACYKKALAIDPYIQYAVDALNRLRNKK